MLLSRQSNPNKEGVGRQDTKLSDCISDQNAKVFSDSKLGSRVAYSYVGKAPIDHLPWPWSTTEE